MNAAAANPQHHQQDTGTDLHMGGALTGSVLFHAGVIAVLMIGLPFIAPKMEDIGNPISVEIVQDMEDKTEIAHNDHIVKERPMHNELEVQRVTPDFDIMKPLPPSTPQPPQEVDTDDVPLPAPIEKEDKKAQPKPPIPKKRPEQAKVEDKKTEEKKEPEKEVAQFQSILKNYLKDETAEENPQEKTASINPQSYSEGVTNLEFQAFQRQMTQCWQLMSGTRYAEDQIVDIRLTVTPDRTVQDAQVVDTMRYNTDTYFRAAADSALRAVRNPRCNPLDLPPQKYEQWKVIVVTFDPRKML
jgi:hypothetical protein